VVILKLPIFSLLWVEKPAAHEEFKGLVSHDE
jgi:hypothetical protein